MTVERGSAASQAGCEVLFELCHGPHGTLHLGRMLRGIDSGRVVMLREVGALEPALLAAVDLARSLAHPQLLKSLGVVRSATASYLASEYVPGVTLLDLEAGVKKTRFPLRPSVAVRIIKDALRAADVAQRLLSDTAALSYSRCLFADTVWIAEFGDVLLTDVSVAPLLGKAPEADPSTRAAKDLLTAGIHLFQLASGEALSPAVTQKMAAYVPEPLAETLTRALGVGEAAPFSTIQELVQALDALPSELQADERDVAEEIQRRVGPSLTQRRNKLSLLELGAAASLGNDEVEVTRVFRSLVPQRSTIDTARPKPSPDAPALPELPKAAAAPSNVPWQEEPTRVHRVPAAIAALRRSSRPPDGSEEPVLEPAALPAPPIVSPVPVPGTSAPSSPAPAPDSPVAAPRASRSTLLWWVGLGLAATLSAAWWATAEIRAPERAPAHSR